jgi:hypothetical protein
VARGFTIARRSTRESEREKQRERLEPKQQWTWELMVHLTSIKVVRRRGQRRYGGGERRCRSRSSRRVTAREAPPLTQQPLRGLGRYSSGVVAPSTGTKVAVPRLNRLPTRARIRSWRTPPL